MDAAFCFAPRNPQSSILDPAKWATREAGFYAGPGAVGREALHEAWQ